MGILDRLARAEVSSDLAHHDYDCHVDILGAAGMVAATHYANISIFRVKYLNDINELAQAKKIFVRWTYRMMANRGLDPTKASRIGVQALTHWVNDICPACNGLKHMIIAGSPTLSDKECNKCSGTGKKPVPISGEIGEVFKDVGERADSACLTIRRGLSEKMGIE